MGSVEDTNIQNLFFKSWQTYVYKEMWIFSGWGEWFALDRNELYLICQQKWQIDAAGKLASFSTDNILKSPGIDSFIFISKFKVYSLL